MQETKFHTHTEEWVQLRFYIFHYLSFWRGTEKTEDSELNCSKHSLSLTLRHKKAACYEMLHRVMDLCRFLWMWYWTFGFHKWQGMQSDCWLLKKDYAPWS